MTRRCEHCGWPESEPYAILSRHRTSQGLALWTRCACGTTRVRLRPPTGAERIVARLGQPEAATAPIPTSDCGVGT